MKFLPAWLRKPADGATPQDPAAHIRRALAAAGLDADSGPAAQVRTVIDDALARAGLRQAGGMQAPAGAPRSPAHAAPAADAGMLQRHYSGPGGSRDYRLHLPQGHADTVARPLLLMLHGCTQSPEDFAAGTRMNALADRHGLVVAYPEQQASHNQARCWNWFRPGDQQAAAGEPAILAGIIEAVAAEQPIDRRRIFVAGLSAGAAMAVVLAHTHPQLVRAIGVHSGLPYGAAHDVPSAFAAMQGRGAAAAHTPGHGVPMIVFHGDADRTVAPLNAERLISGADTGALQRSMDSGTAAGGRGYTRERFADGAGAVLLERWTLHGGGHAWSGGDAAGSYTDSAGPDASAEMLRFFLDVAARG